MKRRSFLQLLGLAPAAAVAPSMAQQAEKVIKEAAEVVPVAEAPKTEWVHAGGYDLMVSCSVAETARITRFK